MTATIFRAILKLLAVFVLLGIGIPIIAIGTAGAAILLAGFAVLIGCIVCLIALAAGIASIVSAGGGDDLGLSDTASKIKDAMRGKPDNVSPFPKGAA